VLADARAAGLLSGTRTMLAGPDSVCLFLQTAHRFPLAGECPLFSAWGRFEDGAPAPRDRLRRKV